MNRAVDNTEILMTAPMLPIVSDSLERSFKVHHLWEHRDQTAFLAAVGPRIRGVATSTLYGRVDASLLERLPRAEIISSFGVGYDNVDVTEAVRRGILVTNTPGVLDEEVADLAVGLLIATLRKIPQADRYLREGHWLTAPFPLSPTLRGRTIGIVGLGRIGKAIARRLDGFGVAISYHGRSRQADVTYAYYPTLIGLAEANDVLIIVTPGGASTKHLINRQIFKALGACGVLINVSRGSVVDEEALIEALGSRTILGAGLDVYEDEPHVPAELIAMENVVLLPHVASASVRTRDAMGQLLVDNLVSWFAGEGPLTPVFETPWR
jgi:lactate dehydrogenase-like 2-hydroxyacid dehydrogenase